MSAPKIVEKLVEGALNAPEEHVNLWIWGPPGVGKSSIVHKAAADAGLDFIDFRAVTCEPTDARGFPFIEDGCTRWARPEFLPTEGEGILFLDELGQAPGLVQAALLQLTLDRKVGEHELPEGWRIIAASNRQEDRAGVGRLNTALLDRFVHVDLDVSVDEWQDWAYAADLDSRVRSFINYRPNLLADFNSTERVSPSPRSWNTVSKLLNVYTDEALRYPAIEGAVGKGAAAEFISFLRTYTQLPSLEEIVSNPENVEIDKSDPSVLYALAGIVGTHGAEAKPAALAALSLFATRLPEEFAVLAIRDLVRARREVLKVPAIGEFLKTHRDLFPRG